MTKPYVIAYARTSTKAQDLALQRIALENAGCDEIFEEQESGAKRNRPVLINVLSRLRQGDTLMVWKIDRLARSLSHLLAVIEDLDRRKINFVSLTENFDTTTPAGRAFFQMCGVMGELERNLIEERRLAGIAKAKLAGVKFGRKRLSDDASTAKKSGDLAKALRAIERGEMSCSKASKTFNIARSTLARHLNDFRTDETMQGVSNIISLQVATQKTAS